jgi:putative ABC transport system ATP-binding protein
MAPSLLLADEPTGNLDSASGYQVLELLERMNAGGLTLIVVTHDPEIGGRADRLIKLVDGRIAERKERDGRSGDSLDEPDGAGSER